MRGFCINARFMVNCVLVTFHTGNDLLCKVHNPLKRLFGHEKNRQKITGFAK